MFSQLLICKEKQCLRRPADSLPHLPVLSLTLILREKENHRADFHCMLTFHEKSVGHVNHIHMPVTSTCPAFHLPHINLSNHVIQEALHDARNQVPISTGQ